MWRNKLHTTGRPLIFASSPKEHSDSSSYSTFFFTSSFLLLSDLKLSMQSYCIKVKDVSLFHHSTNCNQNEAPSWERFLCQSNLVDWPGKSCGKLIRMRPISQLKSQAWVFQWKGAKVSSLINSSIIECCQMLTSTIKLFAASRRGRASERENEDILPEKSTNWAHQNTVDSDKAN